MVLWLLFEGLRWLVVVVVAVVVVVVVAVVLWTEQEVAVNE